jgi:outer membrane protein
MRIAFAAILPAVLLAAAWAPPAAAQLAAPTKIGAISIPLLLRDSPQVRAANDKFKGEFQKREDDLKAEGKKLQDDSRKYQREADTMSGQQRADTEKNLNTRRIDFELKQRQFSEQAQARNDELQREVLDKINRAIVEVAKERGLDLVVRDPAFASAAVDITPDVMKKLAAMQAAPAAAEPKKKK